MSRIAWMSRAAAGSSIEAPDLFSGCRIESGYAQLRRKNIHDSVDDNRIALYVRARVFIVAVKFPGNMKRSDVLSVDLRQ